MRQDGLTRPAITRPSRPYFTASTNRWFSSVAFRKYALPAAQDRVLVVDNSDDTLTLMNLTDKELQNVRVFYKNYDESLGCYLGGVTYSGTVESIVAGESVTVAPEHFVSGSSVVMGSEILKS